jgi:lipid-A-disaccharide synthase-like uncharacterized protein
MHYSYSRFIYSLIGLLAGFLLARFILKLFAAPSNPLYWLTDWLVAPLKVLLKPVEPVVGSQLEWNTLVAIAVLILIGLSCSALFAYRFRHR